MLANLASKKGMIHTIVGNENRGKCKFEETLEIGSSCKWPRRFLLRLQNENNLSLAGWSTLQPLLFFSNFSSNWTSCI